MTTDSQVLPSTRVTILSKVKNIPITWVFDLSVLGSLFLLFYFFGLGSYPLFTPDEGRYSEIAREMIKTHDFITPRLNGVVFLDKPILYYWLQVLSIKLFGLNEWALRFWPALLGIWGCVLNYFCGRTLFNRRVGLLASFILGSTILYFGAAHYANLDLEVAVFISSSLLFFLLGFYQLEFQKKLEIFLLGLFLHGVGDTY